MLGRIRREAESITINGSGIQGVQNIAAQYDSVATPIRNLGVQDIKFAPEGIVNYGTKNFIFTEGYMESYSVSCSLGEVPQIGAASTIYGTFGTGTLGYIAADQYPSAINVAGANSIGINLDEFTTNRVSSFSISINTPRVPIYALNSSTPNRVIAGTPIEVNVSFSLSVDDYEIKNMRAVPEETVFKNTIITVNKNNSETELLNYSFDNMLLVGETFNGDVSDDATVDFSLRSYILR